MMARRRSMSLSEPQRRVLEVLEKYQEEKKFPPSIREIGKQAGISSTSVVKYYLVQLEEMGYIKREKHISRGIELLKPLSMAETAASAASPVANKPATQRVRQRVEEVLRIPVLGRITAGPLMPIPQSDFNLFDYESAVDVALSMLPQREKSSTLFALEVQGDSMIDAMVNDGDIVIMKSAQEARNGEMVAVLLTDRNETTLKYFYREKGRIRLQPANPTMQPIYVDDPSMVEIRGKVVMVIRQMKNMM